MGLDFGGLGLGFALNFQGIVGYNYHVYIITKKCRVGEEEEEKCVKEMGKKDDERNLLMLERL